MLQVQILFEVINLGDNNIDYNITNYIFVWHWNHLLSCKLLLNQSYATSLCK